jgi:hypothetical protein
MLGSALYRGKGLPNALRVQAPDSALCQLVRCGVSVDVADADTFEVQIAAQMNRVKAQLGLRFWEERHDR